MLLNDKASLFCAALELRCCVELRQFEYITQHKLLRTRKVLPFEIGENAKTIKKIYKGRMISKLEFQIGADLKFAYFHILMPDEPRDYCGRKIDNLRHAQTKYRLPSDPRWEETRGELTETYRMAWLSCQGTMLLPPMWDSETGKICNLTFDYTKQTEMSLNMLRDAIGVGFRLRVDYFEKAPEDWICDL